MKMVMSNPPPIHAQKGKLWVLLLLLLLLGCDEMGRGAWPAATAAAAGRVATRSGSGGQSCHVPVAVTHRFERR